MSRSEHHGAGCYRGVWSWPFQWIETRNICMYMHVQANRHANIPAWHTDFRNNPFTPIPLMVINHAELYLAFSHCRFVYSFCHHENTGSHRHPYIDTFAQTFNSSEILRELQNYTPRNYPPKKRSGFVWNPAATHLSQH